MSAEGECVDAGRQCLLLSFPGGPEAGSEGHKTALSPDVDHLPQTLIIRQSEIWLCPCMKYLYTMSQVGCGASLFLTQSLSQTTPYPYTKKDLRHILQSSTSYFSVHPCVCSVQKMRENPSVHL
ncbi:hypothetical protein O3P69_009968 [Scylla paramamosain]|uniref:Uncharacterized protein n=1 Tax=Scylla paramamosain TaxID=85552 RepID=A0AAW0SNJ2_SCYPA